MDEHQKKAIEDAIEILGRSASSDHCGYKDCSIETPNCDVMVARAARKKIMQAIDPVVRSNLPERLTHLPERVFFERWKKENERQIGLNSGHTALELILHRGGDTNFVERPSQRDCDVAAAVIQWLGTACGGSFIRECEAEISATNEERADLGWGLHNQDLYKPRDLFVRLTDVILDDVLPTPSAENTSWKMSNESLAYLRRQILSVLEMLFTIYAYETGIASLDDVAGHSENFKERFRNWVELGRKAVKKRVAVLREKRKKLEEKANGG